MSESDLAKYPGLYLRAGVWSVRKRVPVDLAQVDGRWQVRLSLGTSDKRDAIRKYPAKLAEIEEEFAQKRSALVQRGKVAASLATGKLERLAPADVEGLALRWWETREALRAPELDDPTDELELDELLEAIDDEPAQRGDVDPAIRLADRLLVEAGVAARPRKIGLIQTAALDPAVDRKSTQYRHLRGPCLACSALEGPLARDHLLERRTAPYDPMFNPAGVPDAGRTFPQAEWRTVGDLDRGVSRGAGEAIGRGEHRQEVRDAVPRAGGGPWCPFRGQRYTAATVHIGPDLSGAVPPNASLEVPDPEPSAGAV